MSKIDSYLTRKSASNKADLITSTDVSGEKRALDVAVKEGEFNISGLSTDFLPTTLEVIDTEVGLPATPLVGRNNLAVRNLDPVESIFIGKTGVVAGNALGTTSGWELGPEETFQIDITNGIPLFGIALAGKTVLVKVLEVS